MRRAVPYVFNWESASKPMIIAKVLNTREGNFCCPITGSYQKILVLVSTGYLCLYLPVYLRRITALFL